MMPPTEMHIDALMEKIEKLEAENARYREDLEFYKFTFNNLIEDPKILHLIQIHEERLSYVNDSNITPDELRSILKYALILNIKNTRYREALEFYAWTCEPTKIQRSDNSGTLVMVEDKEKALACYNEDLFLFGKRAREALKGE